MFGKKKRKGIVLFKVKNKVNKSPPSAVTRCRQNLKLDPETAWV